MCRTWSWALWHQLSSGNCSSQSPGAARLPQPTAADPPRPARALSPSEEAARPPRPVRSLLRQRASARPPGRAGPAGPQQGGEAPRSFQQGWPRPAGPHRLQSPPALRAPTSSPTHSLHSYLRPAAQLPRDGSLALRPATPQGARPPRRPQLARRGGGSGPSLQRSPLTRAAGAQPCQARAGAATARPRSLGPGGAGNRILRPRCRAAAESRFPKKRLEEALGRVLPPPLLPPLPSSPFPV